MIVSINSGNGTNNELLKKIDGEKYKESNRRFEEKYALFAPTMNYKN